MRGDKNNEMKHEFQQFLNMQCIFVKQFV